MKKREFKTNISIVEVLREVGKAFGLSAVSLSYKDSKGFDIALEDDNGSFSPSIFLIIIILIILF